MSIDYFWGECRWFLLIVQCALDSLNFPLFVFLPHVGAAIGHPIVRDTVYGYNGSAAPFGGLSPDQLPKGHASIELQRAIHEASTNRDNNTIKMCVHAKVIRFKHPMTGVDLEFTSPPSF